VCPHLESLDIGFTFRSGVKPKDHDLIKAAEQIPSLNSISFDMWSLTGSHAISSMARAMGNQLLDLKISTNSITTRYLSDSTMIVIGQCCKQLRKFTYELVYYEQYYAQTESRDLLSDDGIIALVDGCRKLEYLKLSNAKRVTDNAFITILDMIEQASGASTANDTDRTDGYALRQIELVGFPFVISGNPLTLESMG
jgi:hypothetical protein